MNGSDPGGLKCLACQAAGPAIQPSEHTKKHNAKKMEKLQSDFSEQVQKFLDAAAAQGWDVSLIYGYRTYAEQDELYYRDHDANGVKDPSKAALHRTDARGG